MPDFDIKDIIDFVENRPYSEFSERDGIIYRALAAELAIKFGSPRDIEDAFNRHYAEISEGAGFALAFGHVDCALRLAPHVSRARQESLLALMVAAGLNNRVIYLTRNLLKRKFSENEVKQLTMEYCNGCVSSTDTESILLKIAKDDLGYKGEQMIQRLVEKKRQKDERD